MAGASISYAFSSVHRYEASLLGDEKGKLLKIENCIENEEGNGKKMTNLIVSGVKIVPKSRAPDESGRNSIDVVETCVKMIGIVFSV